VNKALLDTDIFSDMALIAELHEPKIGIVPIGDRFTMDPVQAARAAEFLGVKQIVPMHWGTFALNREPYREPPDRLLAEALRRGLEEHVAILSPGQSIPW